MTDKYLEALECLDRIDNTLCLNNIKGNLEFGIDTEEHTDCDSVIGMTEDLETIKQALLELKSIKEAEPSKALKDLNIIRHLEIGFDKNGNPLTVGMCSSFENIKQALLKAQEQEQYYFDLIQLLKENNMDYYTLKEMFKQQEPKQYLKWEDLEFDSEWKCKAVKLNGTKYKIKYKCDFDFFNNYYQDVVIYSDDDRTVFAKLRDKKQFFNDLHLERVEE